MRTLERKSFLLELHKVSNNTGNQGGLSLEDRTNVLKDMQRGLAGPETRMEYSDEQKELLRGYQEIFDNWDSYAEYINEPMQAIGDKLVEKVVTPALAGILESKGEAENAEVPLERTRKDAVEDLSKAGSFMQDNFVKISSKKDSFISEAVVVDSILNQISSSFKSEINKSYDITIKKSAKKINVNPTLYNKFYDLAVAHHIMSSEGFFKEADIIDSFIIKHAGLWDSIKGAASSAWEGTKSAVKTTVKYIGKGISAAGEAIGKGLKWVAKQAAKGVKYLVKLLPGIGILFSLPFFIKNLIEAIKNGIDLFWDDKHNLAKYGWSKAKCWNPVFASHVTGTFDSAVDEYIRSPEDLKKILTAFRTIGAFWVDVLFAITNGFMAILDLVAIIGAFFPGIGWLASLGAMGCSLLLDAGLMSIEMSAEYFKDEFWDKHETNMLTKMQAEVEKVLSEGTEVEVEDNIVLVEPTLAAA